MEHEDVWVVVFVADEYPFTCSSHAVCFVVFLEAVEAGEDAGVFFRLGFLGAEGVV